MAKTIAVSFRAWQVWCAAAALALALPTRAAAGPAADERAPTEAVATNAADSAGTNVAPRDAIYDDIAVFTEALMLVRRQYAEEKPFRDLIYGAIDGMLVSLDPHSGFLQPQQYQELTEDTSGRFSGIGVHVGIKDGRIVVLSPMEGTPAQRAGLQSGDRIVKIDGQSALGISMDETVRRLRGPQGSPVTVTIEREGRDPFDATLRREEIKVASVKGVGILPNDVGYIRLTQFGEDSGPDFLRALRTLQERKMTALVLDLRDNPGGLLSTAVEIAGALLPKGVEIVSVRGRDGARDEERYRAEGALHVTDIPLAVLVNARSASAAEIVSGALQDHHRAILVGETTFGKASVQNILRLTTRPDCAVRLTTAHYYTPAGRMIHGKGIAPDIVVPVPLATWNKVLLKRAYAELPDAFPVTTREKLDGVEDVQLTRAVDAVTGARALQRK